MLLPKLQVDSIMCGIYGACELNIIAVPQTMTTEKKKKAILGAKMFSLGRSRALKYHSAFLSVNSGQFACILCIIRPRHLPPSTIH